MQAFRISEHGGPEVLEWVSLPDPEPRADQVLVEVRACALNRLDLWVRNGVPGHEFPLPLIPGSEVAGTIAVVGEAIEDLEIGTDVLIAPGVSCGVCDRCMAGIDMLCPSYGILGEHCDGGYAELVAVPRRNILPLPKGLSHAEAAAIPLVFMTAWHMLVARARLEPLEDILIHAAGSGVSSAGIQIARLLGARNIFVTASTDAKLDKARKLGATHTINYTHEDFARVVRKATGGKGVEVVFDHVGGKTFEDSVKALAWAGRIVICGATTDHQAKVNLRAVFYKSLSVLGSTMGSQSELRTLIGHVEHGDLAPVLDRTLPLREAPEAQRLLEQRELFGKIVLTRT
ncbi:MAG: zinc-binding dehydrogenase [bacterium]|nr:zinc-binding dehydrogenase [bacterium]